MATYAAFKHVELYNVGKTKKRVLRPPGGQSSDIFGTDMPATPRSGRNHMASNIFGSTQDCAVKNSVRQGMHRFYFIGDSGRRVQKSNDSHSRLFGDTERPFAPAKNHMKSNIPIGGEKSSASTTPSLSSTNGSSSPTAPTNGHSNKNGKIENGTSNGGNTDNGVSKSVFQRRNNNGIQHFNRQKPCQEQRQESQYSFNRQSSYNIINNIDNKLDQWGNIDNNFTNNNNNNNKYINEYTTNNATNKNVTNENNKVDLNGNNTNPNSSTTDSSTVSPISSLNDNNIITDILCSPRDTSRNPVTGMGMDNSHDRQRRSRIRRDGNPVTGEGYKPAGAEINTTIPSLNGANQVIKKNRVPPGGYSSGLW